MEAHSWPGEERPIAPVAEQLVVACLVDVSGRCWGRCLEAGNVQQSLAQPVSGCAPQPTLRRRLAKKAPLPTGAAPALPWRREYNEVWASLLRGDIDDGALEASLQVRPAPGPSLCHRQRAMG